MKANRHIRREARRIAHGKWFWRLFTGGFLLYFIAMAGSALLATAYREMDIQTWTGFMLAKIDAFQGGLGYTVPSQAVALQMTGASLFEQFIGGIFGSIALLGGATLLLKAVRNREERWLNDSFSGFARPFETLWLLLLLNLRVFLWSLLFVIPGIIAIYRYRQAWYLKSDHPDWSASQCLAESVRMMTGNKWQAFCLDLSSLGWLLVVWVVIVGSAMLSRSAADSDSFALSAIGAIVDLVTIYFFAATVIRFLAARAVFYRETSNPQATDRRRSEV